MTGFARHTVESPLGELTCEIRGVNHRYLDLQIRLPEELRPGENDLRQVIGTSVKRGKVDCSIIVRRGAGVVRPLQINRPLVQQIAAGTREISALLPDASAPNPLDVLRWPGVIEEPVIDSEPLFEEARAALATALQAFLAMRASEGKRLAELIEMRCRDILAIATTVRARMPEVLEAVRTRQKERLDKLAVDADPARLEVELALVAQKLDVDEELDRLESHVSEIRHALDSDEPVGRRLDFLMQELNREANTLGSKSADSETTRASVELKVLIEQMREQIQNVE
ncbi:MAG TPA: YicC/YloC family endoribonuclease [Woeseiaceae bacterium]